jgi:ribose-phosphate pyrophosphokinase
MISVNGQPIEFSTFPDGTSSFRFEPQESSAFIIQWLYDDDRECIHLWYLTKHIRQCCMGAKIILNLPYIPNARMDRVKNRDEVFTLKHFADLINILHFDEVNVLDPHSNVATALLDRVKVLDVKIYIEYVIKCLNDWGKDILLCYPDEGASKRYSEQLGADHVFCIKHRDWRTGKIQSLELTEPEKVKDRNILIVDDICSRGGTFTFTAQALKDAGAKEVFLYVTHCENTIEKGTVLTDGLISHVFTTNSIYRDSHAKVTVLCGIS